MKIIAWNHRARGLTPPARGWGWIGFCAVMALGFADAATGSLPGGSGKGQASDGFDLTRFLEEQLSENFSQLKMVDTLPPYFLSYRVNDTLLHRVVLNKGGMVAERDVASRGLQVEMRVGDARCDNTHPMRDAIDFTYWSGFQNVACPLDTNAVWLGRALKTASDFAYRAARDQYSKILQNLRVRPNTGDSGLDFSFAPPLRFRQKQVPAYPEKAVFDSVARILREVSREFRRPDWVYGSSAEYSFSQIRKRLVTSEGAALEYDEILGTLNVYAETKAEDGMVLWLSKDWSFRRFDKAPSKDSVLAETRLLLARLDSLRRAPVMETYSGPVLLVNKAAAVFVHEVFGHRVEGHRQRAVDEGQTFVDKLGETLTLPSISIEDDPTLHYLGGIDLNGAYRYDDEGVAAQKTTLLSAGVFRNFLFSRSVLSPKGKSNGHGRANLGLMPVARMGNTRLTTLQPRSLPDLRDSLLARLRKAKKPYGLLVHDLSGGYTYTGRDLPQSFKLEPLYVTQIFADGRPDKLVRGVDVVGTPLQSLAQIAAAGNDPAVFNGHCGAESGWVPVSAISPSLLLGSLEFESKVKDQNRPPILPPPGSKP